MSTLFTPLLFALSILLSPAASLAASPATLVGTWEGNLPNGMGGQLRVVFHIDRAGDGFTATLDSPDQGAFGIPASEVSVEQDEVDIRIAAINGGFRGKLAGTTLGGTWTQGGQSTPLTLNRTSADPGASAGPAAMPADAQRWEGRLQAGPQSLRIVFNLGRQPDGAYVATMVSPDQSPNAIPATSASVEDGRVRLVLEGIGGVYEGTLSDDGQRMDGTWRQGGQSFPLTLTRK